LSEKIFTVAILAMGGEGGGVLADWLVQLAEAAGYDAQATSVPGVAQRTGATIYYIEFVARDPGGRSPVLSLMPVPGEMDLVVASELMEAGRALQRGLVTSTRTTLIASTHRVFSMTEKIAMGDGRVDSDQLLTLCATQAQRFIGEDFSALAQEKQSVVSASLFGAISASEVLPFSRAQCEAAIAAFGVGVASSLAAFAAGFDRVKHQGQGELVPAQLEVIRPFKLGTKLEPFRDRVLALPEPVHATLSLALSKCCDYQDLAYSALYLKRVESFWTAISPNAALLKETARGLALWMSFEDIARVADLKIRGDRFRRVTQEAKANQTQVLEIREYLHPRLEEIADALPLGLGQSLIKSRVLKTLVQAFIGEGKVIETSSVRGFLALYLLSATRLWRRQSMRFVREQADMLHWLHRIRELAATHPQLAFELACAQRLVKGYSDTHQRGTRNFKTIFGLVELLLNRGDAGAALALKQLVSAALADDQGKALEQCVSQYGLNSKNA
jgi:indolepyruvate ferredoxin oxidoreductase, beta subunit